MLAFVVALLLVARSSKLPCTEDVGLVVLENDDFLSGMFHADLGDFGLRPAAAFDGGSDVELLVLASGLL